MPQSLPHGQFLGRLQRAVAFDGVSLGLWCAHATEPNAEHGHDDGHLMFVLAGRYATRAAGTTPAGQTPLVYNPPGTVHSDGFEPGPCSFYALSISTPAFERDCDLDLPTGPTQLDGARPRAILMALMREHAEWDSGSAGAAADLWLSLVGSLQKGAASTPDRPRWLRAAYELVRDSAGRNLRTADLAAILGLNPVHLTRTFRAAFGCTPGVMGDILRAQRAAELLSTTKTPLADVALRCGYADQSHFTRRFKRTYGVTPGAYRQAAR